MAKTSESSPGKPRRARKVGAVLAATALVLAALGAVGLCLLGREDPNDPAFSSLAWGDRVERRIDAFVDGNRPEWADAVEKRMDKTADKIGWD